MWETILILIGGVMVDWTLGDPPNAFHPVAWMGRILEFLKEGGIHRKRGYQLVYGVLIVVVWGAFIFIITTLLLYYLREISRLFYIIVGLFLFKSSLSYSGLKKVAHEIAFNIESGNIDEAKQLAATHLVSRDTSNLDIPAIASATVESVTENLTDSLVAPLLYFIVGGVAGALTFRFINTADSMLGYRNFQLEYLGKGSARLDDVAGYLPARLAGLLMVVSAWLMRENAAESWRVMRTQHARPASPNSGWTMAAAAGALGVSLEKEGHYKLGIRMEAPSAEHIYRAVGLVETTYILTIIITVLIIVGIR